MKKAILLYSEVYGEDFLPCGFAVKLTEARPIPVPKEMSAFADAVDDSREVDRDGTQRIPCLIEVEVIGGKPLFSTLQRDPEEKYDTSKDAVEGDEKGEPGYDEDNPGRSILQPRKGGVQPDPELGGSCG
jgi:hypothetical protein